MEFTITCPIDGAIEVGLEDIDNVVLRESDRADITFVCPSCGTDVTVTAVVPTFLMAAIEALADDPDSVGTSGFVVLSGDGELAEEPSIETLAEREPVELEHQPEHDSYCEYFRRQLESVSCVDDALREMDSRT